MRDRPDEIPVIENISWPFIKPDSEAESERNPRGPVRIIQYFWGKWVQYREER